MSSFDNTQLTRRDALATALAGLAFSGRTSADDGAIVDGNIKTGIAFRDQLIEIAEGGARFLQEASVDGNGKKQGVPLVDVLAEFDRLGKSAGLVLDPAILMTLAPAHTPHFVFSTREGVHIGVGQTSDFAKDDRAGSKASALFSRRLEMGRRAYGAVSRTFFGDKVAGAVKSGASADEVNRSVEDEFLKAMEARWPEHFAKWSDADREIAVANEKQAALTQLERNARLKSSLSPTFIDDFRAHISPYQRMLHLAFHSGDVSLMRTRRRTRADYEMKTEDRSRVLYTAGKIEWLTSAWCQVSGRGCSNIDTLQQFQVLLNRVEQALVSKDPETSLSYCRTGIGATCLYIEQQCVDALQELADSDPVFGHFCEALNTKSLRTLIGEDDAQGLAIFHHYIQAQIPEGSGIGNSLDDPKLVFYYQGLCEAVRYAPTLLTGREDPLVGERYVADVRERVPELNRQQYRLLAQTSNTLPRAESRAQEVALLSQ